MEWRDEGVVVGVRRHGESSVILELMTRGHGRHLGVVRGGRSPRLQTVLQPGNSVSAVWRARLEEHLGVYSIEPMRLRAASVMESRLALAGVNLMSEWLRLVPERDPHAGLWAMAEALADSLGDAERAPALMVRFELAVMSELGFGLDLARCAATGSTEDLVWVSPRSGRAVSRAAGAPYADRLLPLPSFLVEGDPGDCVSPRDALAGFRMVERFLQRDVLTPRGMGGLSARAAFLSEVERLESA